MVTIPEAFRVALEHHHAGRMHEAELIYRQILQVKPDMVEAYFNLGLALKDQNKLDDASACFGQVVRMRPDAVEAQLVLGNVFKDQGRLREAIACYQRVLQLQPENADAHINLGSALQEQGEPDQAVACFQRALELKPDYAEAYNNLGNAWKDQGRFADAIACYRETLRLRPQLAATHSNMVYTLLFCPEYDAQAILEEHHRWNGQHAQPLANLIQPHVNDRSPDRRLRIGYVSPDFYDHVVGRNLLPLFREHDHEQFEVTCYANMPGPDLVTSHFQRDADAWRNVLALTDEQLAQQIQQDRIDILVDLTLHMAGNRLLVFARKPAPVQVTFAGYPGTTGLKAIDYRLTDPFLDPPGHGDQYYTEESIRLPDSFWCYDPITTEPSVNPLPALKKGSVTFGCLNNFCKVNALVLELWARVLTTIEDATLMLLAPEGPARRQTLDLLNQHGIASGRLIFVTPQLRPQYLEFYHHIDIGLDTLPYNGHTTSLDAFWMGVPVITLAGQTVVGRAGLSQLSNLGLVELVADTPDKFVHIAAQLAGNLPRLSMLRGSMRERMQNSPLMDAPRFARNIEAAYRKMWQRWCEK